ncbi:MAG: bifunctional diguanylate cyclase/phosphodiesterase [Actinomycetia bacterium]|nr:bifunctional diguanylate cyclase/phosphodiesterase [Actinomycetes bacterium]
MLLDDQMILRAADPQLAARLDLNLGERMGQAAIELIHPADRERAAAAIAALGRHPGPRSPATYRVIDGRGRFTLVEILGDNRLDDPTLNGLLFIIRPVDDRRRAEALAAEQVELLEGLANGRPETQLLSDLASLAERHTGRRASILVADGHGRRLAASTLPPPFEAALEKTLVDPDSLTAGEARRRNDVAVTPDVTTCDAWGPLGQLAADHGVVGCASIPMVGAGSRWLGSVDLYSTDTYRPGADELNIHCLLARLGSVILERRELEARLRKAAAEDPLTGLSNRRGLQALLEADGLAPSARLAVFVVDLDRFTAINNTHGHPAGDRVLVTIADRLADTAGPKASVARLGGDEFLVVLADPGQDGCMAFGVAMLEAIHARIGLDLSEVVAGGSVGLARGEYRDLNRLISEADSAMYKAKRRGGGCLVEFDDELRQNHKRLDALEKGLRAANFDEELRVVYQPIVETGNGTIVGVEALLRWDHPQLGLLSPGDFVEMAEDAGLIVSVDTWMLTEAHRQASQWRETRSLVDEFTVWVNLSSRQLDRTDLVECLISLVEGDPEPGLGIELSECGVPVDHHLAIQRIAEIRDAGISVAIDDFGANYASLGQLRQVGVDRLKIDGSLVAGMPHSRPDRVVLEAIITLARELGLCLVAEGVETYEQLEVLRLLGCDAVQGYLFGTPASTVELERRYGPGLVERAYPALPPEAFGPATPGIST